MDGMLPPISFSDIVGVVTVVIAELKFFMQHIYGTIMLGAFPQYAGVGV
jgi:hypothetical protein